MISGRHAWLNASELAIFTLLTIPVAYPFWRMEDEIAMLEMFLVIEDIGMVGGMMGAALACHRLS